MANKKITELTAAGALTGAELVEVVQSGTNFKTTTQDIADLGSGGPGGAVDSVNGQTGVVVLDAGDIANTPSGGISATDVQAALVELDAEIDSRIAAAVAGIKWKDSARVATTVAGTLASSFENGDTVDGVVLATGNRILIKNQASAIENGIYTVNASGVPTRSTDADAAAELEGASVGVLEGTSNANTQWIQTTDSITLGVSNIVWSTFGTGAPPADGSTAGILKLYNNVAAQNTDGAPDQNSVFDALALKLDSLVTIRTETATHDLDSTDLANINAGDQLVIHLNAAGSVSLEIPTNANVAFPTGTVIGWVQYGAGQITITPLSGATLRSPNAANKSFAQYSRGYIEKIGTNEWILSGDITV